MKSSLHTPQATASRHWFALATVASLVLYAIVFVLSQSAAFHLAPSAALDGSAWLRAVAARLTPASVVSAPWDSREALVHLVLFGVAAVLLVAIWGCMLWLMRRPSSVGVRSILASVVVTSLPLLGLAGLFSADLFLYDIYGRILALHHQNPIVVPPSDFWDDPRLEFVFWTHLPSSYGPVWLALSGALSRIGSGSVALTVLAYKLAALAMHLVTTLVVAHVAAKERPELAPWSAVFYGLNPLVLFEVVGNGHNDVMAATLVAVGLLAQANRRPLAATAIVTAAAMAKATAGVFLLPLIAALWFSTERRRARMVGSAIAVSIVTTLVLYAPMWAGTALLDNIRSNPASTEYHNSIWALLRFGTASGQLFVPRADRAALLVSFTAALALLLVRLRRGRSLHETLAWTWLAHCFFLAWIWPWYLVVAVPLAAMAGPGRAALAIVGVTIGGLLFWTGWTGPPHPLAPWLFEYRALLLVGPGLLFAVVPALSDVAALLARAWRNRPRDVDVFAEPGVVAPRDLMDA